MMMAIVTQLLSKSPGTHSRAEVRFKFKVVLESHVMLLILSCSLALNVSW